MWLRSSAVARHVQPTVDPALRLLGQLEPVRRAEQPGGVTVTGAASDVVGDIRTLQLMRIVPARRIGGQFGPWVVVARNDDPGRCD
jgi:hypothetical protein